MAVIIAKVIVDETIDITDMGVVGIPPYGQRNLSDNFEDIDIFESDDLVDRIQNDKIIINLDGNDLSKADSLAAIQYESKYIDESNDSSGGSNPTEPPENPSMGDQFYYVAAGMPFFWDANREMWLSSRFPLSFSYTGNCANQYLNAPNGYANPDGAYRTICDLHLCSVILDMRFTSNNTEVTVSTHINKVTTGDDFYLADGPGWHFYENYTLDINIPKHDKLQVWCTSNKTLNDAYATFGAAWRYIAP